MSDYEYKNTLTIIEDIFEQIKGKNKTFTLGLCTDKDSLVINDIDISISVEGSEYDSVRITKQISKITSTLYNGVDGTGIIVNNVNIFKDYLSRFLDNYKVFKKLNTDLEIVRHIVSEVKKKTPKDIE